MSHRRHLSASPASPRIGPGPWSLRAILGLAVVVASLSDGRPAPHVAAQAAPDRPSVVVTTEVLGSIVRDLVADRADVSVLMESGADPHAWQPSARDAEALHSADIVVANGHSLEEGLLDVLGQVRASGVPVFMATDHVADAQGSPDPHVWLDPLAMRDVVTALGPSMGAVGVEVGDRLPDLVARLEALDGEVAAILAPIPPERRRLVTGHESLGWFAQRYGFEVVGTVIPGLTTTGDVSARELSALITTIRDTGVPAIFTEVGSPQAVADAVAGETGARLVELRDAQLPEGGTYFDLLRRMAVVIAEALAA